MNQTELVTAIQERLKVTVVLAENHGYRYYLAFRSAFIILVIGTACYMFVVGEVSQVDWSQT
jgi:TPP-dependent trihydroxycyclohexane-1,2-dione (THcHDO) dehydratase